MTKLKTSENGKLPSYLRPVPRQSWGVLHVHCPGPHSLATIRQEVIKTYESQGLQLAAWKTPDAALADYQEADELLDPLLKVLESPSRLSPNSIADLRADSIALKQMVLEKTKESARRQELLADPNDANPAELYNLALSLISNGDPGREILTQALTLLERSSAGGLAQARKLAVLVQANQKK